MRSRLWLAPAVFGASDGSTTTVGALLTLAGHPGQVVPAAVGLSVAGAVGMAAGQWLSEDTDTGPGGAVAIGVATGLGTLLPALPYLWLRGWPAMALSMLVLTGIGALITVVRARGGRSWLRAAAETFGVLAVVCTAVGVAAVATGSSG